MNRVFHDLLTYLGVTKQKVMAGTINMAKVLKNANTDGIFTSFVSLLGFEICNENRRELTRF